MTESDVSLAAMSSAGLAASSPVASSSRRVWNSSSPVASQISSALRRQVELSQSSPHGWEQIALPVLSFRRGTAMRLFVSAVPISVAIELVTASSDLRLG